MATQRFDYQNVRIIGVDADWRSPGGAGYFDDLTFTFKVASAADNDVLQLYLRMPVSETWLIHQMRVYQSNTESFDNVSLQYRRAGREIELNGSGQWDLTTGPVTTYNLFFDSTGSGGGGSVTYGIESGSWKQPPYLSPSCVFLLQLYVNEALGWTADSDVSLQLLVDRLPSPSSLTNARDLFDRMAPLQLGGWFDR